MLVGKSQPVQIVEILGLTDDDAQTAGLAERFSVAIAAYRAHWWEEAAHSFHQLLQEYPDDGPNAFFLKRPLMSSQAPPASIEEVVVKMEEK